MRQSIFEDFPEYSLKTKEYFFETYLYPKRVKRKIKKNGVYYWAAFLDKKIVGYLISYPPEGGIMDIIWLGVVKEYQKKGIGSALLNEFLRCIKTQGVHAVWLRSSQK